VYICLHPRRLRGVARLVQTGAVTLPLRCCYPPPPLILSWRSFISIFARNVLTVERHCWCSISVLIHINHQRVLISIGLSHVNDRLNNRESELGEALPARELQSYTLKRKLRISRKFTYHIHIRSNRMRSVGENRRTRVRSTQITRTQDQGSAENKTSIQGSNQPGSSLIGSLLECPTQKTSIHGSNQHGCSPVGLLPSRSQLLSRNYCIRCF